MENFLLILLIIGFAPVWIIGLVLTLSFLAILLFTMPIPRVNIFRHPKKTKED